MSSHPLARLAGCFATGALAAAVALIGLDQAAPLTFSLKVAWLWLGGNAVVALLAFTGMIFTGGGHSAGPARETLSRDARP